MQLARAGPVEARRVVENLPDDWIRQENPRVEPTEDMWQSNFAAADLRGGYPEYW